MMNHEDSTSLASANAQPPARESPEILYGLRSIVEPLTLNDLFPTPQPLEVELGSGDGTFLVSLAAHTLGHNFLGVERLLGRIRKMARKANRAGLRNHRGIRIESSYFLEHLLPEASVAALHVYFPDPWPKRKHRHHRLINERFPTLARKVLLPCGRVYLRTDDQDYFSQMLEVFGNAAAFREFDTPEQLSAISTDFERDFTARGIRTLRAGFEVIS
jgi:tRNA (guanine-N7-)-methyltransferase